MSKLTESPEWKDLLDHQQSFIDFSLVDAFNSNPQRVDNFSLSAAGLFFDYSKHLITNETVEKLLALADFTSIKQAITDLKTGGIVNRSENRPALHHLLRAQNQGELDNSLLTYYAEIQQVKDQLKQLSSDILNGKLRGYTGKPFTDIVHVGIGGSDLGPAMVYQALQPYHQQGVRCHFVANICANDINETLENINPHTTLFIVASKSFNTLETIKNADTAKKWLLKELLDKEAINQHFMAVTSKPELAKAYGINSEFILPFWDWVGGRYSVWSSISLCLCVGLGYDHFSAFLKGANAMDQHFFSAEPNKNMPIMLALLGIWYTNFWQKQSHAVIPYDHRLRRFPAFLQQLEMESNGKSATNDNQQIDYATCPVIWGEVGANSQHSFSQHLHQGTGFIPIDFIAILKNHHEQQEHQNCLFSNCLAQSQALMLGQETSNDAIGIQKKMSGNRPSSMIILPSLTPETLGSLMALYEHKTYVQSVVWNINAFDQWGVELGKKIGKQIKLAIDDDSRSNDLDESTQQLIQMYQNANK